MIAGIANHLSIDLNTYEKLGYPPDFMDLDNLKDGKIITGRAPYKLRFNQLPT